MQRQLRSVKFTYIDLHLLSHNYTASRITREVICVFKFLYLRDSDRPDLQMSTLV